jgi:6-phosphogluconolactonase
MPSSANLPSADLPPAGLPSTDLRVSANTDLLFRAAAEEFAADADRAIRERGRFTVALSGGSTPRGMFSLLASGVIPHIQWGKICFFWGDERHVPPDSPMSNYKMANDSLLSHVPVDPAKVYRIRAEGSDAAAVAQQYEAAIQDCFQLKAGEFPRFDLILLGLGPDGHTASLFPGTNALQERKRIFVANWVEKLNEFRFTLTFPAINQAKTIAFLVSGAEKAPILKEIMANGKSGFPAQGVQPQNGNVIWFADREAVSS